MFLCDALGIDFADLRDGRRSWRVNNRLNYYRAVARRFYATGERVQRTTRTAIAALLYGDVRDLDDMRRKQSSLRNCEADLVAAGLLTLTPIMGRRGGLVLTLCNPSFDGYTPRSRTRGCSSVG